MRTLILALLLSSGLAAVAACDKPTTRPDKATTGEPNADTSSPDAANPAPDVKVLEPSIDGKESYERVCVTCHGRTGDGHGLEQELFGFGEPAERWTNGPTVDGITRTLNDGIHATSMRPFPDIDDAHRVAIAKYVLILRGKLASTDATR